MESAFASLTFRVLLAHVLTEWGFTSEIMVEELRGMFSRFCRTVSFERLRWFRFWGVVSALWPRESPYDA